MAIGEEYCLRCGREESRCTCEIELVHGPACGEHRGSRPGIDPLFHDAAFRGFEPETPDQAEAFREKLQGFPEHIRPRVERYLGGRR